MNKKSSFTNMDQQIQSPLDSPKSKQTFNDKSKTFEIPLIYRKMNSVEKYIKSFKNNKGNKILPHQQSFNTTQQFQQKPKNSLTQNVPYLKYSSLIQQQSLSKIQILERVQQQYINLKRNLKPLKINIDHHYSPKHYQKSKIHISQDQIKQQINHTKISSNGKSYPANLYLLKKARDKVISSLSTAGRSLIQNNQKIVQQQNIYDKILQKKIDKKNKMIQGKSHWSIYYDLLALTNNQKKKLKGHQKFIQTYGL